MKYYIIEINYIGPNPLCDVDTKWAKKAAAVAKANRETLTMAHILAVAQQKQHRMCLAAG